MMRGFLEKESPPFQRRQSLFSLETPVCSFINTLHCVSYEILSKLNIIFYSKSYGLIDY